MVVSSEDRRESDNSWIVYQEYGVHGRNQVLLEEIRFCGKESGFVGRNQVLLEGIRFYCKEAGFVGRNQILPVVL
jgi:hypothetical protein